MRDLYTLYGIAIDNFHINIDDKGICHLFPKLFLNGFITLEESVVIENHFKSNKPTFNPKYSSFITKRMSSHAYWWDLNEEGDKQRLIFLERLRKDNKHPKTNIFKRFWNWVLNTDGEPYQEYN